MDISFYDTKRREGFVLAWRSLITARDKTSRGYAREQQEERVAGDAIDRKSEKRMGPDSLTVVNVVCPKKPQRHHRETHYRPINPGMGHPGHFWSMNNDDEK